MKTLTTAARASFLVAGGALLAALALGAARPQPASAGFDRAFLLPASRIFDRGTDIVKLDTRDGSMHLMRGRAGATGSGNEWQERVAPVRGETSGLLQMQRAGQGDAASVFLVDVLGDRTWILRWRGVDRGEWMEIRDAP
ncbi:MAG: hypothetical protein ACYTG1_11790 [Planctomycetota bacterium]|jgi:hypothetical protein